MRSRTTRTPRSNRPHAFNAIILTREFLADFTPQYQLQECSGDEDDDVCIMKREGACTPAPDLEVNAMLRRLGE